MLEWLVHTFNFCATSGPLSPSGKGAFTLPFIANPASWHQNNRKLRATSIHTEPEFHLSLWLMYLWDQVVAHIRRRRQICHLIFIVNFNYFLQHIFVELSGEGSIQKVYYGSEEHTVSTQIWLLIYILILQLQTMKQTYLKNPPLTLHATFLATHRTGTAFAI